MPAMYFLGNALLGESPALSRWEDSRVNHQNIAYFCPECGDVWGRVFDERVAGWFATTSYCAAHGGGSFIFPWRNSFDEFPAEVLRYELNLLLSKQNDNTY